MFKIFVVAVFLFSMVGCSANSDPVDLVDTWSTAPDSSVEMVGIVRSETISIIWSSNEDAGALYWKGTFPQTAKNDEKILSIGDTEAMDDSLLGSLDETKEFVYNDDVISFQLTVLGVIQTIHLERGW